MRYEKFRERVKSAPLISRPLLKLLLEENPHTLKNQLLRWQKQGRILRLKRGLYILNPSDRHLDPSRLFVAYELYAPSYVSLEYALSFYGLIPEKVADITCITTRKTMTFENSLGRFIYQHIKSEAFTGFAEQKDEAGLTYFLAVPEKAVVDFLYLNQHSIRGDIRAVLEESFRFQHKEGLDKKKLFDYAALFQNAPLVKMLKVLYGR